MLWYVATPYSKYEGGLVAAFEDACRAAGALMKMGHHVYSPIAHTHPVALHGEIDPYAHDIWMPLDKHMMEAAGGIIVMHMQGWDESRGVAEEIAHFKSSGKPRLDYSWPDMKDITQPDGE